MMRLLLSELIAEVVAERLGHLYGRLISAIGNWTDRYDRRHRRDDK